MGQQELKVSYTSSLRSHTLMLAGARGGVVLRKVLQPLLRERVAALQVRRLGRVRDVYHSLPEVSTPSDLSY